MNIDVPLRELGPIDNKVLSEAVLGLEDSIWKENLKRQEEYEVHRATESIVMIFVNLDRWPEIEITREAGWSHLADAALPLMNNIIERCYPPGGTVIRAMAAKLLAGNKITQHWDKHPSFHCGHRIHVPITTNPRVRFMIDGQPYQFKLGEAYEINNQLNHSVMNKGQEDRITFIFDYVPKEQLEKLSANG
ncbi:MAG: aspartyl/asparaginyl beta-hydroxylase domain-containing protein [Woeseiaceae bacterium]|jgi:aspartyl/asparaginyl beta-hydroxylase (cupin superfamily)|nr:hypothetical protein [Woeseiaceae bacterium]MDG1016735.1 aspartyl/asparaginyl beta-hydroxylase domain-containing protein [Woeseiaceae bacterium]MDG1713130.1 aspartyl/asparaginyl beta-hydroxylase domain-containing protein [Woeseiaceae bacterium]MDG1865561.1 aspartyl/asparaginyl beta-hydroxylase domain-containing protein [Woeseiaceae bacterium]